MCRYMFVKNECVTRNVSMCVFELEIFRFAHLQALNEPQKDISDIEENFQKNV